MTPIKLNVFCFFFPAVFDKEKYLKINVHWCISILHCCFQDLYMLVVDKQRHLVSMAAMVTYWLTVFVVVPLETSPAKE